MGTAFVSKGRNMNDMPASAIAARVPLVLETADSVPTIDADMGRMRLIPASRRRRLEAREIPMLRRQHHVLCKERCANRIRAGVSKFLDRTDRAHPETQSSKSGNFPRPLAHLRHARGIDFGFTDGEEAEGIIHARRKARAHPF